MHTLKDLIQLCEDDLRAGRPQDCARRLHEVVLSDVPRAMRLPLARLCRRTGLIALGFRLLAPVINETVELANGKPSIEEKAEYALLLQRSGGVREALQMLLRPEMEIFPETRLYRAFCYFNLWDFASAVPELEHYLTFPHESYPQLIGATNLASAYLNVGRLQEAEALASENVATAEKKNFARLLSNNRELIAASRFERGDFNGAQAELQRGLELLANAQTTDELYLHKWLAAIEAVRTQSAEPLRAFRKQALARGHFESVRESDLLGLRVEFDAKIFAHLYFGTPYEPYRERMCRLLNQSHPHSDYLLGPDSGLKIDLITGQGIGVSEIPQGSQTHQLIEILFRDLYRPVSLGALFSQLFPGERFSYESSPDRVHQVLRRTRQWIRESSIGLKVEENNGLYSIHREPSLSVLIPRDHKLMGWEQVQWLKLQKSLKPNEIFNSTQAREILDISVSNFKRLSAWGVAQGVLTRRGNGSGTSYKIAG